MASNFLHYYIQCDQIGRKFVIWATLGYNLLNNFHPNKQFWTFKLTFGRYFDIFGHFFQKLGEIFINFLVTLITFYIFVQNDML